ncbi:MULTISPECIES: hypothetical protein [unclassified Desulfovibrio]|uniref:hypothetical protein n=1 Tax=unclassified Desulfovibrio TaxID=2593640 RepID=UPI002FDB8B44
MSDAAYQKEVKELAAKLEDKNLLPDGIGMPLEQVRALLAHTHETVVDKADPILMVVTILNAHLREVEKLQDKHQEGLGKFMTEKTDAYVSGVQEGIAQLTDSLSSASVQGIRKVFDDHAARLQAFKNSTAWLAAIVGVSALLNVAVFVLGGLR